MRPRKIFLVGLISGVVMTALLAALDAGLRHHVSGATFQVVRFASLALVLVIVMGFASRERTSKEG